MTSHAVSFTVAGIAQPKGSTRPFGFIPRDGNGQPLRDQRGREVVRTFTTSDNKSLKGWETNVRSAAQQQCGCVFFDGPVRVAVVFFLPRPKSAPRRVTHHLTRPDVDKLARGCLDALKGILWPDDSKVVDLIARKAFATTQPHARILVDYAEVLDEVAIEQNLFSVLEEVTL